MNLDKVEVRNADGWKQVYAAFDPPAAAVDPLPAAKAAFEAVADPTVLKAFRAAATGFDRPTHYPRRGVNPSPGGEMYEWFVENEKLQIPNALPDLAGDAIPGLPLL